MCVRGCVTLWSVGREQQHRQRIRKWDQRALTFSTGTNGCIRISSFSSECSCLRFCIRLHAPWFKNINFTGLDKGMLSVFFVLMRIIESKWHLLSAWYWLQCRVSLFSTVAVCVGQLQCSMFTLVVVVVVWQWVKNYNCLQEWAESSVSDVIWPNWPMSISRWSQHYSSLLVAEGGRLLNNALRSSRSQETRSSQVVQEMQALEKTGKLQNILKLRHSRNTYSSGKN